jgi:hypothetical protein
VLAIKLYRLTLDPAPAVPILPCLDHEAMLHESVAPHAAAYIQDASSGDLHELVFIPASKRIEVDTVSTWGEKLTGVASASAGPAAGPFSRSLGAREGAVVVARRTPVAHACRAQVSLRDVLLGRDTATVKAQIDRLQTIASLMEKQSRVASWGVRTITGTVLAAAAFVLFAVFGFLTPTLGETGVTYLRYALISVLGAIFLYYGMKAVQLTEMSNRVWKRTAEYNLILLGA